MTLVAQITLGGAPFLIGDALVSSTNLNNPYVKGLLCELPLVGEVNSLLRLRNDRFVLTCVKSFTFSKVGLRLDGLATMSVKRSGL